MSAASMSYNWSIARIDAKLNIYQHYRGLAFVSELETFNKLINDKTIFTEASRDH